MKYNCEIIRDLLPLYAEHIASPASTAMVEEHLAECPACRAELDQMEKPVPVQPEKEPDAPLKTIKIAITRRQLHTAVWAAAVVLVLAVLVGFTHYAYTAYDKVSFFDARLQAHYEQAQNGKTGWVLETRGEDVYLMQEYDEWNFQVIRYRFPRIHNALASLLGTENGLLKETNWMRTDRSVRVNAADMSVAFSGSSGTWQVVGSEKVAWDLVEWPK